MRTFLPFLLFLMACGAEPELVRQTVNEARKKERVEIVVRLERTEMPSADDLALRTKIAEAIEKEQVGQVVASGAEVGSFHLAVEVDSTADGVPRIRELLRELGVLERAVVRVRQEAHDASRGAVEGSLAHAQMTMHHGCGRLWKTVENVTPKTIARRRSRTYLEARPSTDA